MTTEPPLEMRVWSLNGKEPKVHTLRIRKPYFNLESTRGTSLASVLFTEAAYVTVG